jgi:N-acetylmuramoyl-L-alanine amidase
MGRAYIATPLFVLLLCVGTARAGLPTISHEGRNYVELVRVAESLKSRLEASTESAQAQLRTDAHVVILTRNWARILVNGNPMLLDGPVVVRKGVWLVPETFMTQVGPKLGSTAAAASAPARATSSPRVAPAAPALPPPAAQPTSVATTPVKLEELRTRSYPAFTRIVLETSAPVTYRVDNSATRELRIRLLGLVAEPQVESIAEGPVDEVRLERSGADALLRVRFEGAPGDLKTVTLADPPRLVLDFARPGEPVAPGQQTGAPLRTIVLDAGHGGHDSGAVGPGGLMEKELVLDVTKRVAKLATDQLGVKVLLSRDGDHFVTLRDRTSHANRERADLFVSIHANAHRVAASEGLEVFFLSTEATDNAARQLAAAENSVVQLEKPVTARAGRTDIVRTILWDLAQSEFQAESSRLAETMLDSMTQALRIPHRGVKQAGFYVLGGAAMPAVLIEIGFVTNPKEERRLKEARYRDEIARAIASGLADYKRNWDQRARPAAARTP